MAPAVPLTSTAVERKCSMKVGKSYFEDVYLWNYAMGFKVRGKPEKPDQEAEKQFDLAFKLIREEFTELEDAYGQKDNYQRLTNLVDAAGDLIWVVCGLMANMGIDLDAAWEEIRLTNWTKLHGPRRADGKLLKPQGWKPPDFSKAIGGRNLTDILKCSGEAARIGFESYRLIEDVAYPSCDESTKVGEECGKCLPCRAKALLQRITKPKPEDVKSLPAQFQEENNNLKRELNSLQTEKIAFWGEHSDVEFLRQHARKCEEERDAARGAAKKEVEEAEEVTKKALRLVDLLLEQNKKLLSTKQPLEEMKETTLQTLKLVEQSMERKL